MSFVRRPYQLPMDAQIQRQPWRAFQVVLEERGRIPALASREACISLRPYSRMKRRIL